MTRRFPISFDPWYATLSTLVLLPPSRARVEIGPGEVEVRMAWAFRTRFPRSAITSAAVTDTRPLSRGVHGFAGRWLVNGSADGLVTLRLEPAPRAWVLGFPVRVRELTVSLSDPSAFLEALGT